MAGQGDIFRVAAAPDDRSTNQPACGCWLSNGLVVEWPASYQVNLLSHLEAMNTLLPGMTECGWGRVINVMGTSYRLTQQTMPRIVQAIERGSRCQPRWL